MTVLSEHGDEIVESFKILPKTTNISVSLVFLSLPFKLSFFVSSFRLLQVLRGWLGR